MCVTARTGGQGLDHRQGESGTTTPAGDAAGLWVPGESGGREGREELLSPKTFPEHLLGCPVPRSQLHLLVYHTDPPGGAAAPSLIPNSPLLPSSPLLSRK